MCARTTLTITPGDLERTFGYPVPAGYGARYNIAPTQQVLAIGESKGVVGIRNYRWGLVPYWAKDMSAGNRMINARAESVAKKAAFREPFARRRCLVVGDGYYEWQVAADGKRPHRIHLRSGEVFTLAGVWDRWGRDEEAVESCAVLTTPGNAQLEGDAA